MKPSSLLFAVAIVVFVFIVDIVVLWILKKIGGTLRAGFKATVKRFGGNLAITSAGLIGSFLAIAVLAFVAIYLIARLMGV
jgi:hypothetical protein